VREAARRVITPRRFAFYDADDAACVAGESPAGACAGTMKENPKDWSKSLDEVRRLCAVPGMNSARLIRIMEFTTTPQRFEGKKNAPNQALLKSGGLRRTKAGGAFHRIGVANNLYSLVPAHQANEITVPTIIDLIDSETEAVVELGCGFGRNLFAIWNLISHERPELAFIGAELSESGLEAARGIAALEPAAKISFHRFNYLDPSFGFLDGLKNIVVFTAHSIEQVHRIGTAFFQKLLASTDKVRCVHFEPVAWQMNAAVTEALKAKAPPADERFSLFGPVNDAASAKMPLSVDWNIDLAQCLRSLAEQGAIHIDAIDLNCSGDTFYNPSTLIAWTKKK
jgi:SAM-dependent methyltransferase